MEQRKDPDRDFAEVLTTGAGEIGIPFPDSLLASFVVYLRELQAWNRKTNLTAITDEQEIAVKHFLDSLACTKALDHLPTGTLLDVGSGAGFPGLPLKLLHPELDVTLLEPSQKRTAFLRHMIGTFKLDRTAAQSSRIEDFSQDPHRHASFKYIVTRAVNITALLPFFTSLVRADGRIILCRSQPLDVNIRLSGLQIEEEIAYTLPRGYGHRILSVIKKT